ncbi:LEAF RUST 10 DISEASE-RESISTANCE LOCUS RECEPTOR-LIKE PROTEIN KINASE-like 2.8, partial [Mucuna pruriens]
MGTSSKVRMDEHNDILMLLIILNTMCWLLLTTLPNSHCELPAFDYSVCKKHSYKCGNVSDISYPFWGQKRPPQCGGGDIFQLKCHDDSTSLVIGSQNYTVKEINITAQTMKLVPTDLALHVCSLLSEDTYLNPRLFRYSPSVQNITIFYDCTRIPYFPYGHFTCGDALSYFSLQYDRLFIDYPTLRRCKRSLHVQADAQLKYDSDRAFTNFLNEGFEVNYNVSQDCTRCLGSEGHCWSDGIEKHLVSCYYCPNGSLHCSPSKASTSSTSPLFFNFPPLINIIAISSSYLIITHACSFIYATIEHEASLYSLHLAIQVLNLAKTFWVDLKN